MARRQVIGDRANIEPTALVHEARLRLTDQNEVTWYQGGHLFAAAAQAMRRILVELARARFAAKRGGDPTIVPLVELRESLSPPRLALVSPVSNLLAQFAAPRRARTRCARAPTILKLRAPGPGISHVPTRRSFTSQAQP